MQFTNKSNVIYWFFLRKWVKSCLFDWLNFLANKIELHNHICIFFILQKWISCKNQVSFRKKLRWTSRTIFATKNGPHICTNRTSLKSQFKNSPKNTNVMPEKYKFTARMYCFASRQPIQKKCNVCNRECEVSNFDFTWLWTEFQKKY